jgi:hypothetical protein
VRGELAMTTQNTPPPQKKAKPQELLSARVPATTLNSGTMGQKNNQFNFFIAAVAFIVLLIIFTLLAYTLPWDWSGFPSKKVWDWLQLLIVPVVIAFGGLWFTGTQHKAEQDAESRQRQAEQDAESRQRQAERDAESRQLLIQALQGEKESIGFTAMSLSMEGLPQDGPYRGQILVSLVQAAIFSGSDRARAMVYSVLWDSYPKYGPEIDKVISSLDKMFKQIGEFPLEKKELDLGTFELRLGTLRKILKEPRVP